MIELLVRVGEDVGRTFVLNWPYLIISVLAAAVMRTHVGTDRVGAWLRRNTVVAVVAAVALATLTPFCSCGTTAVALGMVATASPWAPIVAFLVASPLTSPPELFLSAGLFGWSFALTFFVGTIALGLFAGLFTSVVERTGWLAGQARMAEGCGRGSCDAPTAPTALSLGPGAAAVGEVGTWSQRLRLAELWHELVAVGRRLLWQFTAFTALGYLVIEAVPTAWLEGALGGDSLAAVLGAAVLGIPVYISTEGSLPMLRALVDGGMGTGPAMAFLVTGAGTSVGAVSGMLVIARRRVVTLVVGLLLGGSLVLGLVATAIA